MTTKGLRGTSDTKALGGREDVYGTVISVDQIRQISRCTRIREAEIEPDDERRPRTLYDHNHLEVPKC